MPRRIERVNNLIRQELSEIIRLQVKDPRLSCFVAITEVSTSLDLRCAKVFVSHIGSEEEKQETLSALTAASGFFRNKLSKHLRLRRIPELSFHWDNSIERGAHLLELIDDVTSDNALDRPRS
jgi:ribosome-binding factor A